LYAERAVAFVVWAKKKWCPTHEQIFDWFKTNLSILNASQSHPKKVTDEQIEKAAPFWKTEREGWIEGAKAMRDGKIK
jgi:hypothetical protein